MGVISIYNQFTLQQYYNSIMSQLLRELNEIMQVECLAQFQAYNKHLINVTYATRFR